MCNLVILLYYHEASLNIRNMAILNPELNRIKLVVKLVDLDFRQFDGYASTQVVSKL